jgi:two-component system phosphate regulon sensor histidine kinase PhoR
LEKNNLTLKRETTDLHELISESVKNNTVALQKKSGKFELCLNSENSLVNIDKLHFSNVLYNLMDNAIKYCTIAPTITITTSSSHHQFTLDVKDNGIGISEDNLKKIFHRFYRVPTGNLHDVKGFGLGLNYVKLVVESHGGKIMVNSKMGSGSTFTILLPQPI